MEVENELLDDRLGQISNAGRRLDPTTQRGFGNLLSGGVGTGADMIKNSTSEGSLLNRGASTGQHVVANGNTAAPYIAAAIAAFYGAGLLGAGEGAGTAGSSTAAAGGTGATESGAIAANYAPTLESSMAINGTEPAATGWFGSGLTGKGLMGGLKSTGEAAGSAQAVKSLFPSQQAQPVQMNQGNPNSAQTVAQVYQASQQNVQDQINQAMQARAQRRQWS